MPIYCILWPEPRCPFCGAPICSRAGQVAFQWGKVREDYHIGDEIKWLEDRSGRIVPGFKLTKSWKWNCGYPEFRNLLAFDLEVLGYPPQCRSCGECGCVYEAIALRIDDVRIESVKVFKPGEIEQNLGKPSGPVDIWVREADGSCTPRYDWYDHPLTS